MTALEHLPTIVRDEDLYHEVPGPVECDGDGQPQPAQEPDYEKHLPATHTLADFQTAQASINDFGYRRPDVAIQAFKAWKALVEDDIYVRPDILIRALHDVIDYYTDMIVGDIADIIINEPRGFEHARTHLERALVAVTMNRL